MADPKTPHDPYLDDPIPYVKVGAPYANYASVSFVLLGAKGLGPKRFRGPGTTRWQTTRRNVLEWLQALHETPEQKTARLNSWSDGKRRVAWEAGQEVTEAELVALREEADRE